MKCPKWVCTDPDTKQYRKQINTHTFLFKEERIIQPITKEKETYTCEIDLTDYSLEEMIDYCSPYGYELMVKEWYENNQELALIAECIFEQTYD